MLAHAGQLSSLSAARFEKCRADAKESQGTADRLGEAAARQRQQQAQAYADVVAESELFIRNVEQGLPDDGEPKREQDLALWRATTIDLNIAGLDALRQEHAAATEASLRAADGHRQAALAAEADRLHLDLAGALEFISGPLSAYVAAYRVAHGDEPPLPDLHSLVFSSDVKAANDEDGGAGNSGGLLGFLRRSPL